jgi:DNA-binding response OmpR family regulator
MKAMKVLVMEPQATLRRSLAYLLERQGVEVEESTLEALEDTDWRDGYDAVLFNGSPLGRRRPSSELSARVPRGTKLICFSAETDRAAVRASEVDAHLPFPFSSSELLGVLLGHTRTQK